MKSRRIVMQLLIAITIGAAPGLEAAAQGGALRVYQVGEITPDRYRVTERIWVDSLRSAFWVPTHADQRAAIEAVLAEAARLGADGVVNLHCLNDSGGFPSVSGHFCYANAIKLK